MKTVHQPLVAVATTPRPASKLKARLFSQRLNELLTRWAAPIGAMPLLSGGPTHRASLNVL